jgi:Ni,Fe-hydrogenase III small subunit/formate hydrogenlyase subunit 6/NADH:ubiquinone oxidoreductase subunit I
MLGIIRAGLRQGFRTTRFPRGAPPALPERFRGLPRLDASRCGDGCFACAAACPAAAITAINGGALALDLGKCLFCTDCLVSCPSGAIAFTNEYRLASRTREGLLMKGQAPAAVRGQAAGLKPLPGQTLDRALALAGRLRRILGRSLRLRQVSAGGCNACEADANVLTTVGWDLGRFGISFVASPRHADGLLVTGPVTRNMRLALVRTYQAVPGPKIVIASGACAISGGLYADSPEACGGVAAVLPVDLFVPGCPPHPLTLLDGLLALLGRVR